MLVEQVQAATNHRDCSRSFISRISADCLADSMVGSWWNACHVFRQLSDRLLVPVGTADNSPALQERILKNIQSRLGRKNAFPGRVIDHVLVLSMPSSQANVHCNRNRWNERFTINESVKSHSWRRQSTLPGVLSSLSGLGGARASHPALKDWAIVCRPYRD
jgi:hypothetical protein